MAFGAFGAPAPAPPAGGFNFGGASSTPAPAFGAPAPAFGAPATSPAPPAAGGFGGFGAPAAPAAPTTGFGFPAPAPAFGAPAPAPGVFGAPAPGAFGAPAPAFGAPAPAFGSPAPAFGAPAPAFGAPAPAFGAPAPAFGAPAAQQPQQQQLPAPISGGTLYSDLPQELRQGIDEIHEHIMRHKRSMNALQTMAPKALLKESEASTEGTQPLSVTIRQLHQNIAALEQETGLQLEADSVKDDYATLIKQAVMYGQWQIQALAIRRGVHLKSMPGDKSQQQTTTSTDGKPKDAQTIAKEQLRGILDQQMAHVDRLERMPSPYLWQVLEDLEKRLQSLKHHAMTVQQQIQNSILSEEPADIFSIVQSQHRAIFKVSARLAFLHAQVDDLRQQYRFYEKGHNVLEKARYEEQMREQKLNNRIQMQYVQAASGAVTTPGQPALAPGQPAPAPAFGGFGSTAPKPAPTSFGGFGAPAAPAPSTGSAFNFGPAPAAPGQPAPAPALGAPAPAFGAPAPAFGAPAPAFGAPASAFGFSAAPSTSSSTPKSSKNKSRNKNRLGR